MRLFAVFVVLVPLLVVGLMVGIVIGAAATQDSVAGPDDVQRQLDEAATLKAADRETTLRRFLLLHEAEGIVSKALAANPPRQEFAPFATPEAKAERSALIGAAAIDFATFCEGRAPRECLLAEAEALMASAPESADGKPEGIGPSETALKVATLLATAGQFDDALRIGRGISGGRELRLALTFIAVRLAKDGQIERAGDVAHDLNQTTVAAESLTWVAESLIDPRHSDILQESDVETASKVLSQAVDAAGRIVDAGERGRTLASVGALYLEIGKIDKAEALIDQITDPKWRGYMKVFLAQRLAQGGDFPSAERLAALVDEDDVQRAEAFRSIAVALAKAGEPAEARRLAGRIGDEAQRSAGLNAVERTLSEALSSAVDFARLEADARRMDDPGKRILALGRLAGSQIAAGEIEAGRAIAAELGVAEGDHWQIAAALRSVAEAFRDIGQREAALRYLLHAEAAAQKEKDLDDRSRALLAVTAGLIGIGAHAEAERVAAGLEDASDRHYATVSLAEALVGVGKFEKAKRLAALILENDGAKALQGRGLGAVSEALAKAADFAGAEALADRIAGQDQQGKAFARIAIALVEDGQLVEAERVLRRVGDGAWRAVALAALASRS